MWVWYDITRGTDSMRAYSTAAAHSRQQHGEPVSNFQTIDREADIWSLIELPSLFEQLLLCQHGTVTQTSTVYVCLQQGPNSSQKHPLLIVVLISLFVATIDLPAGHPAPVPHLLQST
jgi:hypothetical protein